MMLVISLVIRKRWGGRPLRLTLPPCDASQSRVKSASRRARHVDEERASYTFEFKEEAVRLVSGGKKVAVVAHELGISEQTLHNWVKASSAGVLKNRGASAVSADQMEISRLRSELHRVKMERDSLKNRRRPPAR